MSKEIQSITFVLGGYPDSKEEDQDIMRLIIHKRDVAKSLYTNMVKKTQGLVP